MQSGDTLHRASSSIWQSNGLLIRRFGVRIPGGPPPNVVFQVMLDGTASPDP
jgi:hypothetical protein